MHEYNWNMKNAKKKKETKKGLGKKMWGVHKKENKWIKEMREKGRGRWGRDCASGEAPEQTDEVWSSRSSLVTGTCLFQTKGKDFNQMWTVYKLKPTKYSLFCLYLQTQLKAKMYSSCWNHTAVCRALCDYTWRNNKIDRGEKGFLPWRF